MTTGLKNSGLEAENWLGVVGAVAAHYFIFAWFGISAFFIPPLLFIFGFKLVSKIDLLPVYKSFKFVAFFTFWLCLLFGYTAIKSDSFDGSDILSGGFGHELALLFHALIGWGTYLFLVLSLLVFIIYFFNITELISFGKLNTRFPKTDDEIKPFESTENQRPEYTSPQEEVQEDNQPDENEDVDVGLKSLDIENDMDLTLTLSDEYAEEKEPVLSPERSEKTESDVQLIVEEQETKERAIDKLEHYDPNLDLGTYQYPTLELLNDYDVRGGQVTKDELEANKDKIVETLINFKIGISSIKATIGPTVTLYEIVPDAGVKISKIKNLEDDIAFSLSALGIRIIAPIPGKGTIGIEVPNKNKTDGFHKNPSWELKSIRKRNMICR